MTKHMERDLERLQKLILKMAGLVEEAVSQATEALLERNLSLAHRVISGDNLIDLLENEVLDECLKILALHQPVAIDLRRISSTILISTDLERMGDLATEIAERAVQLAKPPHAPIPHRYNSMSKRAIEMLRRSLNSFVQFDPVDARVVIQLDDEVDEENDIIIAELIQMMKSSPELIEAGLSLFSAVRHVERIADHATNIAEDVVYLVEGAMVRHQHEFP